MTLPTARTNSLAARAWEWCVDTLEGAAKLGLVAALAAAGYGVTQVGCRNDAITFAKAAYGKDVAHCDAIQTCWGGPGCRDTAVCHVGNLVVKCTEEQCTRVFE